MDLLDCELATLTASTGVGGPRGDDIPRGSDAIYLLVFDDPDTPDAAGWTLRAWKGSRPCWSTSLEAHGADREATSTVAEAAARRVLAVHGVDVAGWRAGAGRRPMYRPMLRGTGTDGR